MNNLQQRMQDHAARHMKQSMDFEILADVMCRFGWHLVELDRFIDNHHAIDIRQWVNVNCRGQHRSHGRSWLFEKQADAVLFKLKWG